MNTAALDALFDPLDRDDGPGVIVGISSRGRTLYQRATGLASVQHRVPNALATRVDVGSVTKPFTAMLALRLADRGRISLDDPLGRWLPELPAVAARPTLRELLTHRGGCRDYLDATFADGFAVRPDDGVSEFHRHVTSANFAPGQARLYSNSGYALVSLALERAADKPFELALREEVLDPLGLARTRVLAGDWPIAPDLASPHVALPTGGYRAGHAVVERRLGDGCLAMDVGDLLTWLEALLAHASLLTQTAWHDFTTPAGPTGARYGLGLQIRDYRGQRLWGHGGNVLGASALALALPDQGLAIALLANGPAPLEALATQVIDRLLGGALAPVADDPVDAQDLHAGLYVDPGPSGLVLELGALDDSLGVGMFGSALLRPRRADESTVSLATPIDELRLAPRALPLACQAAGVARGLQRVVPFGPSDALGAAERLAGRYVSAELRTTLVLAIEGDGLVARCHGPHGWNVLQLRAAAPGLLLARHALMPFAAAFHVREQGGRVQGLDYASPRTWRLPFVREGAS